MRMHRHLLIAALLPVIVVQPLAAQEVAAEDDDRYERCISSRRIRSTTVENDRNIVFFMRGKKIYVNTLPAPCPGLSRDGRFAYTSYTGRLCRSDMINLLRVNGVGLQQGRVCRLGRFRLVTKEDLDDLFAEPGQRIETRDIEPPSVEEVVPDEGDSSEDADD